MNYSLSRDNFYYANELYHNGLFEEAVKEYEKFLNTGTGWVEDRKTATVNLIQCYSLTNRKEKCIEIILKSFEFDTPRADICCKFNKG